MTQPDSPPSKPPPTLVEQLLDVQRRRVAVFQRLDALWALQESVPFERIPILRTVLRSLKRVLYLGEVQSQQTKLGWLAHEELDILLRWQAESGERLALTFQSEQAAAILRHLAPRDTKIAEQNQRVAAISEHVDNLQLGQNGLFQHINNLNASVVQAERHLAALPPTHEFERLRSELSYIPASINQIVGALDKRIAELEEARRNHLKSTPESDLAE